MLSYDAYSFCFKALKAKALPDSLSDDECESYWYQCMSALAANKIVQATKKGKACMNELTEWKALHPHQLSPLINQANQISRSKTLTSDLNNLCLNNTFNLSRVTFSNLVHSLLSILKESATPITALQSTSNFIITLEEQRGLFFTAGSILRFLLSLKFYLSYVTEFIHTLHVPFEQWSAQAKDWTKTNCNLVDLLWDACEAKLDDWLTLATPVEPDVAHRLFVCLTKRYAQVSARAYVNYLAGLSEAAVGSSASLRQSLS